MKMTLQSLMTKVRAESAFLGMALLLFLGNQLLEVVLLQTFTHSYHPFQCKVDCTAYATIADEGYEISPLGRPDYTKMSNYVFFPLFPAAVRVLLSLGGDLRLDTATILTSKLLFFLSIYAFIKLGNAYLPSLRPLLVGSIAAFNPYSIYGNAGYSEPLFLLLTCCFFILLKRSALIPAGCVGLLLSATRSVGIVAIAPLLFSAWRNWGVWSRGKRLSALAALVLTPIGLGIFMIVLMHRTTDPLAFIHAQQAWRGPISQLGPFSWIASLRRGLMLPSLLYRYMAISGIATLSLSAYAMRKPEYRPMASYTFLGILVPLLSDCWSLPRFIWWQAPVLLAVAATVSTSKFRYAIWMLIAIVANVACYRIWYSSFPWHIA